jgi:hypothetical protein
MWQNIIYGILILIGLYVAARLITAAVLRSIEESKKGEKNGGKENRLEEKVGEKKGRSLQ